GDPRPPPGLLEQAAGINGVSSIFGPAAGPKIELTPFIPGSPDAAPGNLPMVAISAPDATRSEDNTATTDTTTADTTTTTTLDAPNLGSTMPPGQPPFPPGHPPPGSPDDPLDVLDANTAQTIIPGVTAHGFSTWAMDLRAQVSGGTVSTYSW